ncbi:MAG: hypothetical protein HYY18_08135 [Planctomycetes bacterium]|nr:hypothetical protein [Planctomycetota bacterium]
MRTLFYAVAFACIAGCGNGPAPGPGPGSGGPPPAVKEDPPAEPGKPIAKEPGEPEEAVPLATVARHVIGVTLDPASHGIEGSDEIEFEGEGVREIELALNRTFEVTSVQFGRVAAGWDFKEGKLKVRFPAASTAKFTVTVAWRGTVFDPPKRDEVRFVTGEKSSGTIQPEGAYLPPNCGWYPDVPGTMARFTVTARVPETWEFIGQGGRHEYDAKTRRCTWSSPLTVDGLTAVAGPYVAEELQAGRVTVRSYFFEADAKDAAAYRKAAAEWIEHFSTLLAPYPYDDFSVVENFFSTGYGMPSYTLLGQDVVRMGPRYLGEGGLGHEILHCWWGNSVFIEGGNWCEALTTYCSNYHWVEFKQGEEEARKYRRRQIVRFSMMVPPEADYPVRKFEGKVTEADNEIGYGKGSMLFHLVRRRIGDAAFWEGLRRVIRERTGRRASWEDFRAAFEAQSGEKLEELFRGWLDGTGAPEVTVAKTGKGAKVTLGGPLKDLRLRVRSWRPDGPVEADVDVKGGVAEWEEPAGTTRVEVDPGFDVFRRLPAEALPICLNRVVTSTPHAVVYPAGDEAYKELLERLADWEKIPAGEATPEKLKGKSVLVLGGPDVNAVAKRWAEGGKLKLAGLEVGADGWTGADEEVKLGAHRALLVSFTNPDDASRHATLFFPASPAAAKPARLLLYYSWESWFVWRDGQIAARGEFPVNDVPTADLR